MKKKYYENLPLRVSKEQAFEEKLLIDAYEDNEALVLDIYDRGEIIRTVTNPKEYANYYVSEKDWDYKKLDYMLLQRGTKFTTNSKEAIREFTNDNHTDVLWGLYQMHNEIAYEKQENARVNKYKRIQDLMDTLPPVKKRFEKDIFNHVHKNEHVLFYNNDTLKGWCCRCGTGVETEKSKHNSVKKCPNCKKKVIYKSERMTEKYESFKEILYIQPIEGGIVLRYFDSVLYSKNGKEEYFLINEKIRTYHGKTIQDYKKRYVRTGLNEWSDKMPYNQNVPYGSRTIVYGGTLEEVRPLLVNQEHLPLELLAKECIPVPIIKTIQRFTDGNIYEQLFKAGFIRLAISAMQQGICGWGIKEGKTLNQKLGISKTKAKWLKEKDGNTDMFLRLQAAEKMNYGLSEEKIFKLIEEGYRVSELAEISDKQKIMKLYNYLQKAKGYSIRKIKLSHYKDYIGMVTQLEYDLSNDVIRYPKNLKEAHDKIVIEFNQDQADKMIAEKLKNFPNIKTMHENLQEMYGYQNSQFTISLPRDAGDIILEGRELHHCVGMDTYLRKHNKCESIICFLRKTGEEDKSYYTIELGLEELKVKQYYGAYDTKPDQEIVDNWLKEWKQELKKRQKWHKSRIEIAI